MKNKNIIPIAILLAVGGFIVYKRRQKKIKDGSNLDVKNLQTKVKENESVNIDLAKSDSDMNNFFNTNGSITYKIASFPTNGTANIVGSLLTYTPNPNYFGNDVMTYFKEDDSGQASNIGTISIQVNAVYDGGTATDFNLVVNEDGTLTKDLASSGSSSVSTGQDSSVSTGQDSSVSTPTGRGSSTPTNTGGRSSNTTQDANLGNGQTNQEIFAPTNTSKSMNANKN